ncbi:hypothetical protein J437_LFUL003080 [Ladona fulva]|uniref:Ig-like domain-containing protein n=1 Tax=Ladona fulva TaxID=123851 RepID=A0A8K0NWL1_LADFU|nr:hypothetical protein J437_LFUL003080 [Ladona fulva]
MGTGGFTSVATMAYSALKRSVALILLLQWEQLRAVPTGEIATHNTKLQLKCQVKGMNSTPGEAVTFQCSVIPATALRYCEFRPPSGAMPILLEDGTTHLLNSDHARLPSSTDSTISRNSSKSEEESPNEVLEPTATTQIHEGVLNRTKRSRRDRFYGWSARIDYVGSGFSHGDCSAAIKRVSLEDAGIWRCVAGVEEQMVELSTRIELVIHEGSSSPLKTHVDIAEDLSWATFTCHTTAHRPLRFCRFVRANGLPILSNFSDTEPGPGLNLEAGVKYGKYSYTGNGLAGGDCGLTINGISEIDAGDWLCIVGVSGEDGHQKGVLNLRPPPLSLPGGLSLGAILGIGLVIAFVLFVVIHEIIERRASWREKKLQKKRSEKMAKAVILNQALNAKVKF